MVVGPKSLSFIESTSGNLCSSASNFIFSVWYNPCVLSVNCAMAHSTSEGLGFCCSCCKDSWSRVHIGVTLVSGWSSGTSFPTISFFNGWSTHTKVQLEPYVFNKLWSRFRNSHTLINGCRLGDWKLHLRVPWQVRQVQEQVNRDRQSDIITCYSGITRETKWVEMPY